MTPEQVTEQKKDEPRKQAYTLNIHGLGEKRRLEYWIPKNRDPYYALDLGSLTIFMIPEEKAELQRVLAMPATEFEC